MKGSVLHNYSVASQPKMNRIWAAVILGSLTAFGPLSVDMYLPGLPDLAAGFNTQASSAQLTLTSFLIGMAVGQLVVGPMSDARGRKGPLVVGLVIFAISSLLCMAMPSIWGLVAMRFIQGASAAAGIVIARAVARDLYSGVELTKFFALLMLVNGAAPIAAPVAGGQLLSIMPWQGIFGVLTFIGAIMVVSVLWGLPETLPATKRSEGGIGNMLKTFSFLLKDKVFMGYCLAQGFVMAAMFVYIAGSPFLLQEHFNLSPQAFSLFFAMNGAGIIAAAQITGRLAGRVDEKKLLAGGLYLAFLSSVILFLMLWLNAGLIFVMIPLFFSVSTVGIVGTTSFSLAMNDKEKTAGSAAALHGLMPHVFGAAAAPLAGLGNVVPMGIIMAACHAFALFFYYFLCRNK
ncbi:Bcr/CflA family drug resistance efflux transporter [Siminovitchia terrae]|uniref:Bcr/CflA family efflux transporter n=1 Tax=Siminovitchia terrae TaxID=1914933 RepID=A0ABQ4KR62_SIMTE|nr:multidrug effflux MFS transporter [Siminovitchia terrae]GIN89962.1 Bcr/CflA family drug resistance efflux transporter [Siminovitchia terrae]GIN94517.1 Bcr/CflA family drug resistance efflux transporter [Siminovitchia terrae]